MKFLNLKGFLLLLSFALVQPVWSADEEMQRLFLTPEQRAEIDYLRAEFLKLPAEMMVRDFPYNALETPTSTRRKATTKSKNPAQPLTVSAVVLLPNGDQLVRINQRFYKVTTKMESAMATQVIVQGKNVLVPVGETYFPDKKQWLKTYEVKGNN